MNKESQQFEESPLLIDPVCGTDLESCEVEPEVVEHNGITYFFCSAGCRTQFEAKPEDFLM